MNEIVNDGLLSFNSLITSKLQFDFGKFLFGACFSTEAAFVVAQSEVHVDGVGRLLFGLFGCPLFLKATFQGQGKTKQSLQKMELNKA